MNADNAFPIMMLSFIAVTVSFFIGLSIGRYEKEGRPCHFGTVQSIYNDEKGSPHIVCACPR